MPTQKIHIDPVKPKLGSSNIVVGKSVINHRARLELCLTMTEYVFLQFIADWFGSMNKKEPITEYILCRYTGIRGPIKIKSVIQRCKNKKMLIKKEIKTSEGTLNVMYPAEKWFKAFESLNRFEEFWQMRVGDKPTHLGNKAGALKMYNRATKYIDHNELCKKFKEYVLWCRESGTFQKHTSTWLNPEFKYWNDILPKVEKKENKNNKEEIIHEINDEDW